MQLKNTKSKCPFCCGSKITPFIKIGKSQICKECDDEGMILNKTLKKYGLDEFIIRTKN